jgi:hypothetical protein
MLLRASIESSHSDHWRITTIREKFGCDSTCWIVGLLCLLAAASPLGGGASGTVVEQPPLVTTCGASQLRLAASFYGAAAGQFIETLTFTNVSPHACVMSGWPMIQVEDAAQRPVSMRVQRVVEGT